jgi:CheY-like chemotaxis protein
MTKSLPKNIVLYADDDPDDLMLVKDAFSRYSQSIEVVTASDGIEALSYLKNLSSFDTTPCLIILDINMPRLNGKEALKDIRSMKRFEDIPVVLFTTSSQPTDKTFASTYNAGFLKKPIDISQMEIITDQFIQHCAEEVRKKIGRISQ